jgi:hypothetical protein
MARATRLYAIIARDRRKAVIFRRGPSKQVALIAWDMGQDKFTVGQWLKGRIYERRCDLSPSGDLLVYFAANWKYGRGPGTWTAVSRPPYLTALALWPKGDTWDGGGLFEFENRLLLNHPSGQSELASGFRTPDRVRVVPFGDGVRRGEDNPLAATRDHRDGWRLLRPAVWRERRGGKHVWFEAHEGELCAKPKPGSKLGQGLAIHRTLDGIKEDDGPWYVLRHALVNEETGERAEIGRSDWADWDGADVVFARDGRLYRLKSKAVRRLALEDAAEIADFSPLEFATTNAPAWALKW